MNTTVTVGTGRSIHWGSQDGTICGAAHRNGRFTKPKTVAAATADCKRCVRIMAAQVEEAHAEALVEGTERVQAVQDAPVRAEWNQLWAGDQGRFFRIVDTRAGVRGDEFQLRSLETGGRAWVSRAWVEGCMEHRPEPAGL